MRVFLMSFLALAGFHACKERSNLAESKAYASQPAQPMATLQVECKLLVSSSGGVATSHDSAKEMKKGDIFIFVASETSGYVADRSQGLLFEAKIVNQDGSPVLNYEHGEEKISLDMNLKNEGKGTITTKNSSAGSVNKMLIKCQGE